MKSWQSKLLKNFLEDEEERGWEIDASVGAHQSGLIAVCHRCTKLSHRIVNVQEVCVQNWGTTDGQPWTESRARCHLAEDVIRIPGVDWANARTWPDARRIKIMAVMACLPYFSEGLEKEVKIRRLTELLRHQGLS